MSVYQPIKVLYIEGADSSGYPAGLKTFSVIRGTRHLIMAKKNGDTFIPASPFSQLPRLLLLFKIYTSHLQQTAYRLKSYPARVQNYNPR